ncbi:hypothetical protein N3K66_000431 [Trichothecium roseum]|uniref:Uncharacterized protein n=1 Tax=Trichothecium roseum TaxID=47278 RepID=A0ACC0VBZ6_9HYPO|nr:hypothetical protein N3K66_000431 [Trichothecium roseum]
MAEQQQQQEQQQKQKPKIKAVFFDFMGTCLDWHSSVVDAFPPSVPRDEASRLALDWRQRYFDENSERVRRGLDVEDIDVTLARTLDALLAHEASSSVSARVVDEAARKTMVQAWHSQRAWPEVKEAIRALREDLSLEVFVHANGTTRLQLDLARSSGLSFDLLMSSQLLGAYKPRPEAYGKGMELVGLGRARAGEVALVAAHAYDLRGAAACGMRTVYVRRWTDDVREDMGVVRGEVDVFLDDMRGLPAAIAGL